MLLRSIIYYAWSLISIRPTTVVAAIAHPIGVRILWPVDIREGIRIVDPLNLRPGVFAAAIAEALDLIQENDPIRFARVKREIGTILNMPVIGAGAAYSRCHRTCKINLDCFSFEHDRKSGISFIACMLIHEATHGFLCTRKIPQTKHKLLRVEQLCWNEEWRFARKINFDLLKWDPFVPPPRPPNCAERLKFLVTQVKRAWKAK
jgi:hypothetical protein